MWSANSAQPMGHGGDLRVFDLAAVSIQVRVGPVC
jgi:hypothetical protein